MDTTSERSGEERRREYYTPGEAAREAEAALASEARRIFELQQLLRWEVAQSTAKERARKLERLRRGILAHRGELHAAMARDFNKAATEVELSEIQPTLIELDHAKRNVGRWMRPRSVPTPWVLAGTRSEIRPQPKGVVLIMAPWNYPASLLLTPLIAAVAAGNCAILRPSEKVPATAAVLANIVAEVFDESEVACLTEPGIALATALLELPFDHVFFTGSTRVGRLVMSAAARHLTSVTLELGGKSPLIVDASANVEAAAERAMWGKYLNAGQTCIAPDYALVHESVAAPFLEACNRALTRFYGASSAARRASPDFPRLVDAGAFRRVAGLLAASVAKGARVAIGGEIDETDRYVAPTIVTGVTWDMPLMQEEIFGPVLPMMTFADIDTAVREIRARGKPLALYVFSRRQADIEHVLALTASGGVAVNNVVLQYAHPELPFGGVGESGIGSYHGEFGFRAFSHERSVLVQRRGNLTRLFYPPYTRAKARLIEVVGRLVS